MGNTSPFLTCLFINHCPMYAVPRVRSGLFMFIARGDFQCSFKLVIIRYTYLVLPLYDAILVCWIIFWHPRETKKLVKSQVIIFFRRPLTQNRANGQIMCHLQYMWVNLSASLFYICWLCQATLTDSVIPFRKT